MKPDQGESGKIKITRMSKASWFKVEVSNIVIHFDPGYSGYFENQGIPVHALANKADLVLISHFHKDHLQPAALNAIVKEETIILAPESCRERIAGNWHTVKPGDAFNFLNIPIFVVDAYNTPGGHSTRKVHRQGDFVGFLLNAGGRKIYFAGDTDLIPEMKTLGDVEIAFLPIGGTFVMDSEEVFGALQIIKPKIFFPMHQSKTDINQLVEKVNQTTATQAVRLGVGDEVDI